MKQPTSAASRIMMEMFWHQGSWAIGYLVIVFLLNLALGITGSSSNIGQDDFFSIIYRSTKGFMLVIGIISSFGFLSFYVRHGFTRRDFFKGAALAALLLSIAFPLVVGPVSLLLSAMNFSDTGNSPVLQAFEHNWFLALASFGIQIFVYYLMGWMIGSGFYRHDWIRGLGFIAIAIVLVGFMDALWQFELASLWDRWMPAFTLDVPLYVSLAGSAVIMLLGLVLIRLLTRKVTIKLR